MKRKFRLTRSTDFKRVRRSGKSYAHPLVVLICLTNDLEKSRLGVAAGRSVGNAVHRNRAKRRLREIIRPLIPMVEPGWDIILLARKNCSTSSFKDIESGVLSLFRRAGLIMEANGN